MDWLNEPPEWREDGRRPLGRHRRQDRLLARDALRLRPRRRALPLRRGAGRLHRRGRVPRRLPRALRPGRPDAAARRAELDQGRHRVRRRAADAERGRHARLSPTGRPCRCPVDAEWLRLRLTRIGTAVHVDWAADAEPRRLPDAAPRLLPGRRRRGSGRCAARRRRRSARLPPCCGLACRSPPGLRGSGRCAARRSGGISKQRFGGSDWLKRPNRRKASVDSHMPGSAHSQGMHDACTTHMLRKRVREL